MGYNDYTAKSVDEAITQACLDLGVTSDRLEYSVVQEAASGFLGIGSRPAIIRARVRAEEEKQEAEEEVKEKAEQPKKTEPAKEASEKTVPVKEAAPLKEEKKKEEVKARIITNDEIEKRAAAAAAARAKADNASDRNSSDEKEAPRTFESRRRERFESKRPEARRPERHAPHHEPSRPKPERVVKMRTEEEAEALKKTAGDFLRDVFRAMNIEAEMTSEYSYEEGAVSITFSGDEMGILIGKRGQTLDSLQYLTSLVVNKNTDEYVRVKLDTEDYRSRRADTLNNLARNIAFKVKKTRRPVALEPMNPYERRIIHYALQGNKYVETYSEGEEPYRHVVVAPKW